MTTMTMNIDEHDWMLFKLKVGDRQASGKIRQLIKAFVGQPRDPGETIAKEKLYKDFSETEKIFNDLKFQISILESQEEAEQLVQEQYEKEQDAIIARARYNTLKDRISFKMMRGD